MASRTTYQAEATQYHLQVYIFSPEVHRSPPWPQNISSSQVLSLEGKNSLSIVIQCIVKLENHFHPISSHNQSNWQSISDILHVVKGHYNAAQYITMWCTTAEGKSDFNSQKTPHNSHLPASYMVYFVRIWEKIDHILRASHCTMRARQMRQNRAMHKADSRVVPRQWETALLCNNVSYWLSASLESALHAWNPSTNGVNPINFFSWNRNILVLTLDKLDWYYRPLAADALAPFVARSSTTVNDDYTCNYAK